MDDNPQCTDRSINERGKGHGPIREATIEVYDGVLEAEQCEECRLKVPNGSDAFETHPCDLVKRSAPPKPLTEKDRNERSQDTDRPTDQDGNGGGR